MKLIDLKQNKIDFRLLDVTPRGGKAFPPDGGAPALAAGPGQRKGKGRG